MKQIQFEWPNQSMCFDEFIDRLKSMGIDWKSAMFVGEIDLPDDGEVTYLSLEPVLN